MINVQHRHMYGIIIECPIYKESSTQVRIDYMDNTNLWARLDNGDTLELETCKAQEGINRWGESLVAVGGTMNLDKCSRTVHNMIQGEIRDWKCRDTDKNSKKGGSELDGQEELDEELDNIEMMTVPQLLGDAKTIELLKSSKAVKNLGLFSRPDGCSDRHMLQMQDMMEDWTK